MKTIKKSEFKALSLKVICLVVLLISTGVLMAQDGGGGTHPGMDPDPGMTVPIDGGILMAILAGSGLLTMMFKKKKKEE